MRSVCVARLGSVVTLVLLWGPSAWTSFGASAAPQTQPAASRPAGFDAWRLYRDSCRLVLAGNFNEAYATMRQAVATAADLPNLPRLSAWLEDYHELSALRERLRLKEYDSYVTKAREFASQAKWAEAMDSLTSAFWAAPDEKRFRAEPWLKEVTARAFDYAEELRRRGEWAEASRIYAELATIFPGNSRFKDLRSRCGRHVRLEALYADDPEWKQRIQGISPEMARDAFWRVDRFYYRDPDLKQMAISGLDGLIALAETTGVFKTFESLADEQKRLRFVGHLREQRAAAEVAEDFAIHDLIRVFDRALQINARTVQLPEELIVVEFVTGAFDALDRFTSMIWPAELAEFRKHTKGEFSGVGIQISMEDGRIKVFSPLEGTPAYEAGIEPGDFIVGIDGKSAKGITLEQAVRRITGEPGTKVVLTIERSGVAEPFDVTITRARIKVPTVKGWSRDGLAWNYFLDPEMKIAFVRVTSFTENTFEAFSEVLRGLRKQGLKGLILDLRTNPGGLLKTAVEMVDLFLPPEKLIVSTKGRASEPWSIPSRTESEFSGLPLVILVNDYSASASEIVAGALHAHGRAFLVGQRTYGKGSVQNPWPLGNSEALLKLTTALYYLPFMDRSIHRTEGAEAWGVQPDVAVKLTPREGRRVLELRRKSDVLPGKSGHLPPASAPASQPDDGPWMSIPRWKPPCC